MYFAEKDGYIEHIRKFPFLCYYWNLGSVGESNTNTNPFLCDILTKHGWCVDEVSNNIVYKPTCRGNVFDLVLEKYQQLLCNTDIFPFKWSQTKAGLVKSTEYKYMSTYPVQSIHKFNNADVSIFWKYIQRYHFLINQTDKELCQTIVSCGWIEEERVPGYAVNYTCNASHFKKEIQLK